MILVTILYLNELDLIVISYVVFSEKTTFLISGHVHVL